MRVAPQPSAVLSEGADGREASVFVSASSPGIAAASGEWWRILHDPPDREDDGVDEDGFAVGGPRKRGRERASRGTRGRRDAGAPHLLAGAEVPSQWR